MNDNYFEDYFDEMNLSDKNKSERQDLAFWIYMMMLLSFSLIETMQENDSLDKDYATKELREDYKNLIKEHVQDDLLDAHILDYIAAFAIQEIDATFKRLDNKKSDTDKEKKNYYLSDKRAMNIGANEANAILNYRDYKQALNSGYTKKQWISENDKYVRITHKDIDGTIVDIDEPFVIKDSLLMYPKDTSLGADPDEIVNCRCTIKYIK